MMIISSSAGLPDLAQEDRVRDVARNASWTLALRKGCASAIRLNRGESVCIHGKEGMLWVTIEGDPKDYALTAADRVTFSHTGLIVLEGLESVNEATLLFEANL